MGRIVTCFDIQFQNDVKIHHQFEESTYMQSAICKRCTMGYYKGKHQLGHEDWRLMLQVNAPPEREKRIERPTGHSLLQYHDHVPSDEVGDSSDHLAMRCISAARFLFPFPDFDGFWHGKISKLVSLSLQHMAIESAPKIPGQNPEGNQKYKEGKGYHWAAIDDFSNKESVVDDEGNKFSMYPLSMDSIKKLAGELPPDYIVLVRAGSNHLTSDAVSVGNLAAYFDKVSDMYKKAGKIIVPRD
jgi:hypothetical protein